MSIGNNYIMEPEEVILPSDHNYSDVKKPINQQGIFLSREIIEDNVRIGVRTIILRMLPIGTGSFIGAGSIVRKNSSLPYIMGGIPGKIIKERGVSL